MGQVNVRYYFSVPVCSRATYRSLSPGETKVIPQPLDILGKSTDFQDQKQESDVVHETKAGKSLAEFALSSFNCY